MDIKQFIKSRGSSITFVASKIGISRQSLYSRLDNGVSIDTLMKVAKALGYKVVLVPEDRQTIEGEYTL